MSDNTNNKNVLFITWDSGITSYVENLYIPIFSSVQKNSNFKFHILQYTWANHEKITHRKKKAAENNISFTSIQLENSTISKIKNLLTSKKVIRRICRLKDIDILMPRSIWPAAIVLISRLKLPIIFDADGLAYLEKKDFRKTKVQNQIVRFIENRIINKSNVVLTKSDFAINWYIDNYRLHKRPKFYKIENGVDGDLFYFDSELRKRTRNQLKLKDDVILFIYVGSVGAKYGLKEIFEIFELFQENNEDSELLILSSEERKIYQELGHKPIKNITILNVEHKEVNSYINAADIGFCLIRPTKSVRGVNPIKLNEYLMAGLPVIVNHGIGDTERWLQANKNCIFIDFNNPKKVNLAYIGQLMDNDRKAIANRAKIENSVTNIVNSYIFALSELKN